MSLIEDINQLKENHNLNYKNIKLVDMILSKLDTKEREALLNAIKDNIVTAQGIAEILNKHGYSVSSDSIRRYRRRLNSNGSN